MRLQRTKTKEPDGQSQILGAVEASRPFNGLVAGLAGWLAFFLAGGSAFNPAIFLSIFFISGYGNLINDIADRDIDKKNKPHRPIPSGRLSIKTAKVATHVFSLLGLLFAAEKPSTFLLALLTVFLLFFYAFFLKKYKVIGNAVISLMVGFTFLFGGLFAGGVGLLLPLAAAAFLANFAREIFKDLEEKESRERATLKQLVGERAARRIAAVLLILAMAVGLFVFPRSVLIMAIGYVILLAAAFYGLTRRYAKAQTFVKAGMVLVLLAVLFGKFV